MSDTMSTFECIAKTWPLHAQRIAELTTHKEFLQHPSRGPHSDIMGLFEFLKTEEGHEYWWDLATRAEAK